MDADSKPGRTRVAVGLAVGGGPEPARGPAPLPAAHQFCGHDPGRPAGRIRYYPTGEGKGGEGVQVYQPLVESWLVISTWPAHGFTRVNLSSCKHFDHGAVSSFLGRVGEILMEWHNSL